MARPGAHGGGLAGDRGRDGASGDGEVHRTADGAATVGDGDGPATGTRDRDVTQSPLGGAHTLDYAIARPPVGEGAGAGNGDGKIHGVTVDGRLVDERQGEDGGTDPGVGRVEKGRAVAVVLRECVEGSGPTVHDRGYKLAGCIGMIETEDVTEFMEGDAGKFSIVCSRAQGAAVGIPIEAAIEEDVALNAAAALGPDRGDREGLGAKRAAENARGKKDIVDAIAVADSGRGIGHGGELRPHHLLVPFGEHIDRGRVPCLTVGEAGARAELEVHDDIPIGPHGAAGEGSIGEQARAGESQHRNQEEATRAELAGGGDHGSRPSGATECARAPLRRGSRRRTPPGLRRQREAE